MMYFLLLLHNFKSSVTLECWIKRNSLQEEWIMPAMTSSTGITLRACSALSRKQLIFIGFLFFFFFLYIIFSLLLFFLHTNTHTHTPTHTATAFLFVQWLCRRRRNALRETHEKNEKASSSFFLSPLFVLLFQTVARSTYPTVTVYTVRIRMWREKTGIFKMATHSKRYTHNTLNTHTQTNPFFYYFF